MQSLYDEGHEGSLAIAEPGDRTPTTDTDGPGSSTSAEPIKAKRKGLKLRPLYKSRTAPHLTFNLRVQKDSYFAFPAAPMAFHVELIVIRLGR